MVRFRLRLKFQSASVAECRLPIVLFLEPIVKMLMSIMLNTSLTLLLCTE